MATRDYGHMTVSAGQCWPRVRHPMATLKKLPDIEAFIRLRLETYKYSYKKIKEELNAMYPGYRGFSERSIRHFCKKFNIGKVSKIG